MTAPVTEAQAQAAVRDLFRLHGWQVLKTEEDRFRGIRGLPDLLCTSPTGVQLWVECKRPPSSRNPRGHVRKAQRELLAEWRRRGVPCLVADGADEHVQVIAGSSDTPHACVDALLVSCDAAMMGYRWWPS